MKIVFCLPGKSFSNHFLLNWSALLNYCHSKKMDVMISNADSSNIYECRSLCLGQNIIGDKIQKPFGGREYDYIMWLDSDVMFKPEQFQMLLDDNKEVVAGLYLMERYRTAADGKRLACFAAMEHWKMGEVDQDWMTYDVIKDRIDPFEITYAGMGFVLMKAGILEKIGIPWFKPIIYPLKDSGVEDVCSEDVSFCLRIKENGFKIWADPRVIVGHEKLQILMPQQLCML